jgi:hypothetical protein
VHPPRPGHRTRLLLQALGITVNAVQMSQRVRDRLPNGGNNRIQRRRESVMNPQVVAACLDQTGPAQAARWREASAYPGVHRGPSRDPKPFISTKSADEILASMARFA